MVNTILFPSSYFDMKKVDEDLMAEYDRVYETELFDTNCEFNEHEADASLCIAGL